MSDLVQAVIDHAHDHYNDGGWDVVVECYEREDVARVIRDANAATAEEAIAAFRPLVSIWAERQADARNSAF